MLPNFSINSRVLLIMNAGVMIRLGMDDDDDGGI
jgi:hypothetical protein